MKENEIKADTFVYHRQWGVGKIVAVEDDGQWVLVDFRDRPRHRMTRQMALGSLSRLPNDGLEATLWSSPDMVHGWVKKGPLRLVAAALTDAGGTGKASDLRTRLQQVLRDVKWSTWWKRIQPLLKESPYFRVKEGAYILVGNASDVPEELPPAPLPRVTVGGQKSSKTRKPASSKEWIKWLLTGVDLPPPANAPPKVVLEILDALPTETLETIGRQLLYGLRLVLQGKRRPSARTLATWVVAVSQLSNRWAETSSSVSPQTFPESLAEFTANLLDWPRHKALAKEFLPVLVTMVQKNDQAAQAVARSLTTSLQAGSRGAVELLQGLVDKLPETTRKLLSKRVVSEIFRAGPPEQHHLCLQAVDERDRECLLKYLALLAVDGQVSADKVTEVFRREWLARQETARPLSLSSLLVATLLLGDAAEPLRRPITDGFRFAIRGKELKLPDPVVTMLVGIAREEILQTQQELEQRLRNEMDTLNAQLLATQTELERWRRITDDLQQQLARQREEARLEIRRDMLLAIGEILQVMSVRDRKPADIMADLEAGLSLALRAGGAEVLGRVGEKVSYDPGLHQADEIVDEGAPVVITAPGVLVSGQLGDLVLLKARVIRTERGIR